MVRIFDRDGERVAEDRDAFFETDSMLMIIHLGFLLIPLKAQLCIPTIPIPSEPNGINITEDGFNIHIPGSLAKPCRHQPGHVRHGCLRNAAENTKLAVNPLIRWFVIRKHR